MVSCFFLVALMLVLSIWDFNVANPTEARIPIMKTTTASSRSVKPECCFVCISPSVNWPCPCNLHSVSLSYIPCYHFFTLLSDAPIIPKGRTECYLLAHSGHLHCPFWHKPAVDRFALHPPFQVTRGATITPTRNPTVKKLSSGYAATAKQSMRRISRSYFEPIQLFHLIGIHPLL